MSDRQHDHGVDAPVQRYVIKPQPHDERVGVPVANQ